MFENEWYYRCRLRQVKKEMTKVKRKKIVRVDDMIRLTQEEVKRFHNFRKNGNTKKAQESSDRISGMMSLLSLSLPIDETFNDGWYELYSKIWGLG